MTGRARSAKEAEKDEKGKGLIKLVSTSHVEKGSEGQKKTTKKTIIRTIVRRVPKSRSVSESKNPESWAW